MTTTTTTPPNFGSIAAACRMVGGDKSISIATYYRGVKRGIYPAPHHPSPNISRVDLDELARRLRAHMNSEETAAA